jgi:hypothetical protein
MANTTNCSATGSSGYNHKFRRQRAEWHQAKLVSDESLYATRKSELRDLLAEAARNTAALPVEDER